MVDNMVTLLGKEQLDDNDKKEYCEALIDRTEDSLKALELKVSDLGKAIADHKESVATLAEEIEALGDGIKALDKQVAEATEERKEEHEDNTETLAQMQPNVPSTNRGKAKLLSHRTPAKEGCA